MEREAKNTVRSTCVTSGLPFSNLVFIFPRFSIFFASSYCSWLGKLVGGYCEGLLRLVRRSLYISGNELSAFNSRGISSIFSGRHSISQPLICSSIFRVTSVESNGRRHICAAQSNVSGIRNCRKKDNEIKFSEFYWPKFIEWCSDPLDVVHIPNAQLQFLEGI